MMLTTSEGAGAGRPAKPEEEKRIATTISLYAGDKDRLDQLTDNRSEFVRQAIDRAWSEQQTDMVTVRIPRFLLDGLLASADQRLDSGQAAALRALVDTFTDG